MGRIRSRGIWTLELSTRPRAFVGVLKTHSTVREIVRAHWAYAFILPAFIGTVLFQVWPSIQAVHLSLFDAGPTTRVFVGLDNYSRFLSDPLALTSLRNTLLFVAGSVPLTVGLSLVLAVLLSGYSQRVQAFLRGAYYLPVVAGSVILAVVWRWFYNPSYGILPFVLKSAGIDPPVFLGDSDIAIWALVAVAVMTNLGVPILVYMASLAAIPIDLYDAARIDGAGGWSLFSRITLPLLRPTTLFVVVVVTIGALQIWDLVFLMTLGGPEYSTFTLGYMVYTEAFTYNHYGYASAVATVLLVLVLVVVAAQLRLLRARS